jgi:hypothetical protein
LHRSLNSSGNYLDLSSCEGEPDGSAATKCRRYSAGHQFPVSSAWLKALPRELTVLARPGRRIPRGSPLRHERESGPRRTAALPAAVRELRSHRVPASAGEPAGTGGPAMVVLVLIWDLARWFVRAAARAAGAGGDAAGSKQSGPVVPPQPPKTRVRCPYGHEIRTRDAPGTQVPCSPRGHGHGARAAAGDPAPGPGGAPPGLIWRSSPAARPARNGGIAPGAPGRSSPRHRVSPRWAGWRSGPGCGTARAAGRRRSWRSGPARRSAWPRRCRW